MWRKLSLRPYGSLPAPMQTFHEFCYKKDVGCGDIRLQGRWQENLIFETTNPSIHYRLVLLDKRCMGSSSWESLNAKLPGGLEFLYIAKLQHEPTNSISTPEVSVRRTTLHTIIEKVRGRSWKSSFGIAVVVRNQKLLTITFQVIKEEGDTNRHKFPHPRDREVLIIGQKRIGTNQELSRSPGLKNLEKTPRRTRKIWSIDYENPQLTKEGGYVQQSKFSNENLRWSQANLLIARPGI